MSAVGIVSIAAGVLGVCRGGPLLAAPAAFLRWFKRTFRTNGRVRVLGAFLLTFGATMVWAGASLDVNEQSTLRAVLALILFLLGLAFVGIAAPWLVLFPGAYRALVNAIVPSDASGSLILWRMAGLAGLILSVLLIYFGARAL